MKFSLPHPKRSESQWHMNSGKLRLFYLSTLCLASFFIFFFYPPYPFKVGTQQDLINQKPIPITPKIKEAGGGEEEDQYCDLFKGRWIEDTKGSVYTNWSCRTLPDSKNCGKYGKDFEFLQWRWKPDGCDLPRFDPKTFFRIVHGKKLAFIGDSVARNQVESLLCLLSLEENPTDIYKDSEDRFRTWYFPSHDFTVLVYWSKFLVVGEERVINGSFSGFFNLHLDKIDNNWGSKLLGVDYAIISDAHWFFRKNYLYEGGKLIGCMFCSEANITDHGLGFALRRVFRTVLQYLNDCKECKGILALIRTFSPAHFENGTWNDGGNCIRTRPLKEEEANLVGTEWELRSIQVEEVESARKKGEERTKFVALDVTRAMLMRPDGHPGAHWNNKWMAGYNDCVHWCLPGPIDLWNDLLLAVLSKQIENSSSFMK